MKPVDSRWPLGLLRVDSATGVAEGVEIAADDQLASVIWETNQLMGRPRQFEVVDLRALGDRQHGHSVPFPAGGRHGMRKSPPGENSGRIAGGVSWWLGGDRMWQAARSIASAELLKGECGRGRAQ